MLRFLQLIADSSKEPRATAGGCVTGSPLADAVHELYRRLGLCECAIVPRKT